MRPTIVQTVVAALFLVCTVYAQQPAIRGTVTGSDGKPLPSAHVWLSETGEHGDKWMLKVRSDGSFFFPAERPGAYIFSATGVNHSAVTSTVFLKPGDTIRADVTLGGLRFKDSDGAPLVVGAFSKYWCEKEKDPDWESLDFKESRNLWLELICQHERPGLFRR